MRVSFSFSASGVEDRLIPRDQWTTPLAGHRLVVQHEGKSLKHAGFSVLVVIWVIGVWFRSFGFYCILTVSTTTVLYCGTTDFYYGLLYDYRTTTVLPPYCYRTTPIPQLYYYCTTTVPSLYCHCIATALLLYYFTTSLLYCCCTPFWSLP